jgi:hypothetical protein
VLREPTIGPPRSSGMLTARPPPGEKRRKVAITPHCVAEDAGVVDRPPHLGGCRTGAAQVATGNLLRRLRPRPCALLALTGRTHARVRWGTAVEHVRNALVRGTRVCHLRVRDDTTRQRAQQLRFRRSQCLATGSVTDARGERVRRARRLNAAAHRRARRHRRRFRRSGRARRRTPRTQRPRDRSRAGQADEQDAERDAAPRPEARRTSEGWAGWHRNGNGHRRIVAISPSERPFDTT